MTQAPPKSDDSNSGRSRHRGLFRTLLAGSGRSLADAIANLERAPQVERLLRHAGRDLLGARVNLTPEEGEGYWELIRIRDDVYVIIENYVYKDPRLELLPGDGLIYFSFRISGDLTLAVTRTDSFRLNRPSLLVWLQPTGVDTREWIAPGAHERTVTICMRPSFLLEHFL